jgi:CRP-like cAMP-binding protein
MVSALDLAKLPLFVGIPESKLKEIEDKWVEMSVKAGEELFCEGCEADKFYILLEGNVSLWMRLTSRPESLVLGVINKMGQSFGWSVIVEKGFYTASAEAKEDSKILAINGKEFTNFLSSDKEIGFDIAMRMVDIVSSRLRYYRVLLKTF